jgi:hypothetical protein
MPIDKSMCAACDMWPMESCSLCGTDAKHDEKESAIALQCLDLVDERDLALKQKEAWKRAAQLFVHCIGIPEQYEDAGYEINKALKHAHELEKD